ncbi:unnamed protein product [Ambrosiozyma monospora]|uniref:Mediator of RNA polymerase II transcription subunit 20 n=1 Tax=Ambrosiozyma monospora TaxID=43982 RepID=A0A9W6YZ63_AMBMO|nr:unnamed protein product [Ambrosiozyma monospora]
MVTAVLLVHDASPTTISQFHDSISNELPKSLGPWNFELKIYLNNKYSKPHNINANAVSNKYLYNLKLSYLQGGQTVSIINNTKSIVCVKPSPVVTGSGNGGLLGDTDGYGQQQYYDFPLSFGMDGSQQQQQQMMMMQQQQQNKVDAGVSRDGNNVAASAADDYINQEKLLRHISYGCCNSLPDDTEEDFEMMLEKLQSLWSLKQIIKGEGGFSYLLTVKLPTGNAVGLGEESETFETFKLRTCNCFLHGAFKGFLIEIEHISRDGKTVIGSELIRKFTHSIEKIKQLIEVYKFPGEKDNLCFNVLSESKLDYLSDLCQQYCDALQF